MKKVFATLVVLLFLSFSINVFAQKSDVDKPNYQTGIGVKFFPFAVSLKTRVGTKNYMEFLGYFKDGFRLTGLYEFHGKINEAGNVKWYLGFGGHAGFASGSTNSDVKLGADGILGIDYKFRHLPLNLSLDWQPALGIGDDNSVTNWGGLAVRFTL
jgi:hypothetical protein